MTVVQWLLLGHLLCAFGFVSAAVVAGVLQWAAIRRDRPSEIAILLQLIRPAVAVVTLSAVGTLGFGLVLADQLGVSDSALWLRAAVALWVLSMILGGVGGRRARHTRNLAESLAASGDAPSAELKRALTDPATTTLNTLSFVALVLILVLMVWQPT